MPCVWKVAEVILNTTTNSNVNEKEGVGDLTQELCDVSYDLGQVNDGQCCASSGDCSVLANGGVFDPTAEGY